MGFSEIEDNFNPSRRPASTSSDDELYEMDDESLNMESMTLTIDQEGELLQSILCKGYLY